MRHGPADEAAGRDEDPGREPAGLGLDPRFDGDQGWQLVPPSPQRPQWELDALADDEPPAEDEDPWGSGLDPDDLAVWLDDTRLAAVYAEAAQVTADAVRAQAVTDRIGLTGAMGAVPAAAGRRGPGMPGSAKAFPGEYVSRASGFASGMPLDTAPGCLTLGQFAEQATGEDNCYDGASDDELVGVPAPCGSGWWVVRPGRRRGRCWSAGPARRPA